MVLSTAQSSTCKRGHSERKAAKSDVSRPFPANPSTSKLPKKPETVAEHQCSNSRTSGVQKSIAIDEKEDHCMREQMKERRCRRENR